jgi:adenylyl-sulfate kinase
MNDFNQDPKVIWLTGLSGSGKTTLATLLHSKLRERNFKCCLLDGDVVRKGLNKDLGFSESDRKENIRRIAEVSKLFIDTGIIVIAAFISPFEADRRTVREVVGAGNMIEVLVDCPLEVCEQRDTKGLYRKARSGELQNFTGISSPYERPTRPDTTIATNVLSIEESLDVLLKHVLPRIHPATEQ